MENKIIQIIIFIIRNIRTILILMRNLIIQTWDIKIIQTINGMDNIIIQIIILIIHNIKIYITIMRN